MNFKSNELFQSYYLSNEQNILTFQEQENEPISYIIDSINEFESIKNEEQYSRLISNNLYPIQLQSYIGEIT